MAAAAIAGVCVLSPAAAASAAPRAADWPTGVTLDAAHGIDFGSDVLYVAQRYTGISSVDPSGVVTRLITSSDPFMSLAVDAHGDLIVTVDSDPRIYRIDIADVVARPEVYLVDGGWHAERTVVFTAPTDYLYGLDIADDGTLYYSDYESRQIIRVVDGVATPLLAQPNSTNYTDFDLSDAGDLTTVDNWGRVTRISAAAMQDGTIAPGEIVPLRDGVATYGIAFFSNGVSFLRSDSAAVVQDATGPVPEEPEVEEPPAEEPPVVSPAPSGASPAVSPAVAPAATASRDAELAATGAPAAAFAAAAGTAALLLGVLGVAIGRRRARSTAG